MIKACFKRVDGCMRVVNPAALLKKFAVTSERLSFAVRWAFELSKTRPEYRLAVTRRRRP